MCVRVILYGAFENVEKVDNKNNIVDKIYCFV